jgi:hypothetical protein
MFRPIWPSSGALNVVGETAAQSTLSQSVLMRFPPLQFNSKQILCSFPFYARHVLWIAYSFGDLPVAFSNAVYGCYANFKILSFKLLNF